MSFLGSWLAAVVRQVVYRIVPSIRHQPNRMFVSRRAVETCANTDKDVPMTHGPTSNRDATRSGSSSDPLPTGRRTTPARVDIAKHLIVIIASIRDRKTNLHMPCTVTNHPNRMINRLPTLETLREHVQGFPWPLNEECGT